MDDLSFDEFRAIEQRNRAKKREKEKKDTAKESEVKEPENSTQSRKKATEARAKSPGVVSKIGEFLEMQEMQATVCFLLLLDIFSSFFVSQIDYVGGNYLLFDVWYRGLKAFSTFALFFFVLEMTAMTIVFNTKIIGHVGYFLDFAVVGAQVYFEFTTGNKVYKLLNFIRLWRILRLFFMMLELERANHELTTRKLELSQKDSEELRDKLRLAEDDVTREKVMNLGPEMIAPRLILLLSYRKLGRALKPCFKITRRKWIP
jgi:hypothetical protein